MQASPGDGGQLEEPSGKGEPLEEHQAEPKEELREEPKEEEEWFPSHKYFVAGTWSNFSPVAMQWDGSTFVHCMTINKQGWESFQILQGGFWDKTVYPSIRDANPYAKKYRLCGPDTQGNGKNWTMGIPPDGGCSERNAVKPGDHYRIDLAVDRASLPTEVSWKKLNEEEMKAALAQGLSGRRPLGQRRVLVLRHGSRPDTQADPPLDVLGFMQAEKVAKHLGREAAKLGIAPVTALFCSPFLRALQTAAPVAQALKLPIRIEEGFCELLAHEWLHNKDPLPSLGQQRQGLPGAWLFDGEYKSAVKPSYPDVVGRMRKGDAEGRRKPTKRHRKAIQAALAAANGGSVLVVGHGATHDFLAEALCPRQHLEENHTPHCVEHCSITEMLEQDGSWHLAAFGACPWKKEKVQQASPAQAEQREDPSPPAVEAKPVKTVADKRAEEEARAAEANLKALREAALQEQQAFEEAQPTWVVVGGGASAGIVVRAAVSLHSREIGRLSTGARVLEVGITRDRLHYRKLQGDGPDFGWVSVRHKDVELMRRED